MQTEAVFENIAERIQQEISKAQKSIFIAVAWFTNKNIFNELVNKVRNGCTVSLIISNDTINLNSSIDFEQLLTGKSKVYKIGNGDTELMHNKFCVIDYSTVITGSYNWSYKAESNFENVIITSNDTTLAEQFISEFNNIRKQYYPDTVNEEIVFPLNKIIKRLEILKNYILLEDIEELNKESSKLKEYDFNCDLQEIIDDVRNEEFASAINKIQNFISKNHQLSIWTDPEIAALKLEIKNLENQLNGYDNEKIELEKLLSEFQHRHTIELGEIILDILKLRKLKFKSDKTKFEEAENDERQYREQIDTEKKKEIFELTDEQKLELKKEFRKATVLCHPDKVADEFKDAAQRIFIDLKEAYDANDLKKVSEILNELEKGSFFKTKSETVQEKDLLKVAIAKLKRQIKILETEIISIKESETFKTIISIEDWDDYFQRTKEKLQRELEDLQLEIEV
ncbi:phospholipase D-like domain-containing protein [Riemerella anatipestifer]|uniref:phospholipase D-like domain-containing protein n=1 Tax=Riemerella anatipestifer TaxID=34085 RepID=UPI002A8A62A1|nr:phospholipase D-like domain-containing protein [Riemerella anatipestifer]